MTASRDAILEYIDESLHRSVMAADPSRSSAEHRRRLNDLQIVRREEMALMRTCASAQDVVEHFFARARSGSFDEINSDAHVLGLPTIRSMLAPIRLKALALGLHCDEVPVAHTSSKTPHVVRNYEPAEHAPHDLKSGEDLSVRQDILLDEAIEETFPASDSISVKRIV